jgi:hypothetical protein
MVVVIFFVIFCDNGVFRIVGKDLFLIDFVYLFLGRSSSAAAVAKAC